jgi:hypothetical protein
MTEETERTTVGASPRGRQVMKWLKEESIFPAEMDVYRFAIALGVCIGKRTPLTDRQTSFNVGSFDADGAISALVREMLTVDPGQTYRAAEELAETGFAEMAKAIDTGEFRFSDFLDTAKRMSNRTLANL